MIKARHIIFDLDGTLIDSAPAILAGFEAAFIECGLSPKVPLTSSVIGPPLMETLATLASSNDPAILNPLAAAFISHYDNTGYLETKVFPGVARMLDDLRDRGHNLYVATNKRIYPTLRIVELFGWQDYFLGVYALDSFTPPLSNKSELLERLLTELCLAVDETLYIGDRNEDQEAAAANKIRFLMVDWGYEQQGRSSIASARS